MVATAATKVKAIVDAWQADTPRNLLFYLDEPESVSKASELADRGDSVLRLRTVFAPTQFD